jgi:hypothetical protein
MQTALLLLLTATPLAGFAFVYTHAAYWTQGGNCTSCRPELFSLSIVAGVTFAVLNLVIWQAGESLYPATNGLSRIGKFVFVGLLVSLGACFVLVGLFMLPVVAVLASVGYLAFLVVVLRQRGLADE